MKNANNGAGEAMPINWDHYSSEIVAAQTALDDKKEKADASHIERIKAIAAKFPRNLDVREIHANKEFHKSLHAAFLNADKDGVARYTIGTAGNYTSTYKTVMLALSHGVTLPASVNNLAKAYEYCRRELGELGVMSKKAPKPEKAVTADGEIVDGDAKPEKQHRATRSPDVGLTREACLAFIAADGEGDTKLVTEMLNLLTFVFGVPQGETKSPYRDDFIGWAKGLVQEIAQEQIKHATRDVANAKQKQLTHA